MITSTFRLQGTNLGCVQSSATANVGVVIDKAVLKGFGASAAVVRGANWDPE